MGFLFSTLCDIVMDDLETTCLKLLKEKSDCIPLFYHRYVDDTILCIKKDQLQSVLDTSNGYNEYLQFTHEIEIDNSINFLDLTMIRKDNNIITNWFQNLLVLADYWTLTPTILNNKNAILSQTLWTEHYYYPTNHSTIKILC